MDTIKLLIEADEFKATEREMLLALPIDAVPLLTNALQTHSNDQNHTRAFYLLATKVSQCETQLEPQILTAAIDALLSRIRPSPNPTIDESVSIRGNIKQLAGLSDKRIIEAIRAARAVLEKAVPSNSPAVPTLDSTRSALISPSAQAPTPEKSASASPKPVPSEEPISPTTLSIIVGLVVATSGLLWWKLNRRS